MAILRLKYTHKPISKVTDFLKSAPGTARFGLENRYAGSKSPVIVLSFAGPPRKKRSRTEGLVWLGPKKDLAHAVVGHPEPGFY